MAKVGIVKDAAFLSHFSNYPHPESPERLLAINQMLDEEKLLEKLTLLPKRIATAREIELIHTPEYLKTIEETSLRDFTSLDNDTYASKKTFEAALLAAGGTIECVEEVSSGKIDSAFAFVRPPGHHAESNKAMGFCIFNNIAIAAKYALTNLSLSKVAIVDFDIHHGNGTQNAFWETDEVLYISVHQFPHFPGTGNLTEIGQGKGEGFTVNIPIPSGCGDIEYLRVFNEIIAPVLKQYKPSILLVSAGFDIYDGDPLGGIRVTRECFSKIGEILKRTAHEICHGKIVYVLEGGYSPIGLREGSYRILKTLLEKSPNDSVIQEIQRKKELLPIVENVKTQLKNRWSF